MGFRSGVRREEFFTELLPTTYYPFTISSSSVITSNINSNKIYVIDSKRSANNVSAAVLTYDYDTECFQTLSNPRKTYVSPKEC